MLNIITCQGNVNQKHSELPLQPLRLLSSERWIIIFADECCNPHTLLVEMQNGVAVLENGLWKKCGNSKRTVII